MPPVADLLAYAGLLVIVVGFLRWAGRSIAGLVRTLDQVLSLVKTELTPDHGSSIKDDVTNLVSGLHATNLRIDQVHAEMHEQARTLQNLAEANHLIWPAIEAVARATPPTPEESETYHHGIQAPSPQVPRTTE